MSRPTIYDFAFDDENTEKIARHGLRLRQVRQVLQNPHWVGRNRRRRRGLYLVIGSDAGGTYITIPVERTREPTIWRPITAWRSRKSELARLRKVR